MNSRHMHSWGNTEHRTTNNVCQIIWIMNVIVFDICLCLLFASLVRPLQRASLCTSCQFLNDMHFCYTIIQSIHFISFLFFCQLLTFSHSFWAHQVYIICSYVRCSMYIKCSFRDAIETNSFAERFEYINDGNIYYGASTIEAVVTKSFEYLKRISMKRLETNIDLRQCRNRSMFDVLKWTVSMIQNVHIAHKWTIQQMFYWCIQLNVFDFPCEEFEFEWTCTKWK